MKKLIALLFISGTFLNYGQSNQILDFKAGYSPQTVYNQTTLNASDYEVTYSGSETFLETLKKNQVPNPTTIKSNMTIETLSKTGKANKEGMFPITIEYVKAVDGNGKIIIPGGTLLYGNATSTTLPKMDSIVAKDMEESLKNVVFQTVQSTFSQLVMPQKKLKIGESFVQESPLTLPIAGINIEMMITTVYKLKSMNSKDAFFDISQTYTMKMSDTRFDTTGSGIGSGELTYDIPNHFMSENTLKMDFNLNLKHTDFSMELKSKSDFKQTSVITKNK
ncbi:hypothetical protein HNP37_004185 [Flavobacterium nitrogenifigens]|uniref:Uncharacterized protein n=2 Tax=Flavobacterium TaxID=237 RepID=A0A7W7J0S0_9FLAO|nr:MULTISPECIES: hypothetical protein [Flavobacterium]MBB4804099.1 hypothetical protein [Flavobacterium nitrogenifigens]MBB6389058.1 hypothetical protein [Flavobacterium notoginsengisoli]